MNTPYRISYPRSVAGVSRKSKRYLTTTLLAIYLLALFFMRLTPAYAAGSLGYPAGWDVRGGNAFGAGYPGGLHCRESSINAVFDCLDQVRAYNSPSASSDGWTSVWPIVDGSYGGWYFDYIDPATGNTLEGWVAFSTSYFCDDGDTSVRENGQIMCVPAAKPNILQCVADPIDITTGEVIEHTSDIHLGGVFPIKFDRTYHSLHNSVPDLVGTGVPPFGGTVASNLATTGNKWDHSYNLALAGDLGKDLSYTWQSPVDGSNLTFDSSIQGLYDAQPLFFMASIKAYRDNGTGDVFTNTFNPHTQCFESADWGNSQASNQFRLTMKDRCASKDQRIYKLDNGDHYELYDSTGKLTGLESYSGIGQSISYESGNIKLIQDSLGHSIEFFYVNNKVDHIADNTGRTWNYKYDANGNLEYVYYPDNAYIRYHYDSATNNLVSIDDRRGTRYANFEYLNGKATSSYLGSSTDVATDRIEGVDLSFTNNLTTLTNSNNGVTRYYFNNNSGYLMLSSVNGVGCFLCGPSKMTYYYDPTTLDLSSLTEYGLTTDYSNYDQNHNPQTITEAASTPDQRQKTHTYDPRYIDKVATTTKPSVHTGSSKVTTNSYGDFGNIVSVSISGFKPDGTAVSRTTNYTYAGPYHQLSQIDGPRSDVSDIYTIDYYPDQSTSGNNRARILKVTAPEGVVLLDNAQYSATGKRIYYTDGNGKQVNLDYYPGNDRLETMTITDASLGTVRKTHWTYLATGEVETITRGYETTDASTITLEYDDARRLTRVYDGLNNYIQYTLDTESNVTNEDTYDSTGALYKQLSHTFDDYNRLDVRTMLNQTENADFKPNGKLDQLTDGKSVKTKYGYDALQRLTSITQDVAGTDATTANALTQIAYDSQDHVTSVTTPNNANTTYVYDDLGNLLSTTSADTGTTTYTYDAAGNVITHTDAKGQQTTYSYDALNRVTSVDMPGTDNDIINTYDNCQKGSGRLCQASNPNETIHYAYDAEGNVVDDQSLQYSYDAAGRTKTIRYPSGAVVNYDYDLSGHISKVALTHNGVITALAYNVKHDPFGPLSSLQYGNGLAYNQVNDQAYRTFSQVAGSVFNLSYDQYDANGNLKSLTDNVAANASSYSYDALNRLDAANGSFGTRNYDYDKNGNRTRLDDGVITPYSYETNSNRMSAQGSLSVLLDANGNTPSRGSQTFSYTPDNRIYQVFDSGVLVATYGYNGLGQRVFKQLADGTGRRFIYGIDGKLLAETDINGNILHEYIFMGKHLLAEYDPDTDGNGLTNSEQDVLGTNPTAPDDDGDGLSNLQELFTYGTSPSNADTDGDGITDNTEITAGTDPLQSSGNPFLLGDINMDGQVNAGDMVLMQKFVLGTSTPTSQQFYLADINQDGALDVRDMLMLTQTVLHSTASNASYFGNQMYRLTGWLLQQVPEAMAASGNGEIYYIHSDHLGTPRAMTNEAGIIVWSASYNPFGKATVNDDVDGDGKKVVMNVRLPGQYYDSETGLHQNYYRDYDPDTGRYIESDPVGLRGGVNTYSYAFNNPLFWIDPQGRVAGAVTAGASTTMAAGAGEAAAGAGLAATGAAIGVGVVLGGFPSSIAEDQPVSGEPLFNDTPNENENPTQREARCNANLDRDMKTCDAIARSCNRPKGAAARCRSSAMQRYGNCLAGRQPGPLDTWNN